MNSKTTDYIINIFKNVHGDKYDYSKVKYVDAKTKVCIICKINNHGEFWQNPNDHRYGSGCPKCCNALKGTRKSKPNGNSVFEINPTLIRFMKNKEDAHNYTISSGRKIFGICPDCGYEKELAVLTLNKYGFACPRCSDSISTPEKFGINLLSQLGVGFETQKTFGSNKRLLYDFFIDDKIIEVHGIQHYKHTGRGRSLDEEQNNDLLKYNFAIENGIEPENYIVIDCRYSTLEWLKENYIKELSNLFDLSNINWDILWIESQKSIKFKAWELWNNKKEHETTADISKLLGVNSGTLVIWLKCGVDIGMCNYDPKYESSKIGGRRSKTVYQYSMEGVFIREWKSTLHVEKELGIFNQNISACARGETKFSGGYVWKYEKL